MGNEAAQPQLPLLGDLRSNFDLPALGEPSLAELGEHIRDLLRQSSREVQPNPNRPEARATIPSPTERIGRLGLRWAEWRGLDRNGQQRMQSLFENGSKFLAFPLLADALFYASRGEPGNTMLAAAGGIPGIGPAGRKGGKLLMDEASRVARAKEANYFTNMPLYGQTASVGEHVVSPAVQAEGRVFQGKPNHFEAMQEAERATGKRFEDMNLAPIFDGFVTSDRRYVSRWEAAQIARDAGQGQPRGRRKIPVGLASEDLRSPAKTVAAASDTRTGATASGLPGGEGIWLEVGHPGPGNAGRTELWHRAARPISMDVRGVADHEIQVSLKSAWDLGHDAVMLKNYIRPGGTGPENIIVVRNKNQLRSPKAAFDPAKRNSQNILAGAAGAAVIPPALRQGEEGESYDPSRE